MADLLSLDEASSADDRPTLRPQWRAFLSLGFRPLYLGGCAWAVVSIALWVFAPGWLVGNLGGLAWHAHEMLWGFVATIAVGFLFTAGANWTGVNPAGGAALASLCLLWLIARVGFLLPGTLPFVVAALAESLFFLFSALALALAVGRTRNRRNYGVPVLLAALGLADGLYLWASWQGETSDLMGYCHAGLLCMAAIALLIARRVIPFFAMRAVPGLTLPSHTRSGQWQLALVLAAVVCLVAGQSLAAALPLAVAGGLGAWQWLAWRPLAVRHQPLLWILYAGYAALSVGLMAAAAWSAGWIDRASWAIHLIGVAGFSVLILGMTTRTALGHLGRPLRVDGLMLASFWALLGAAVLRLLALVPGAPFPGLLHGAAGAWVLAFGLYLWRFAPWLVRPRADEAGRR